MSKLSGKNFLYLSIGNELVKIWELTGQDQISNACESIYDRIENWIELYERLRKLLIF